MKKLIILASAISFCAQPLYSQMLKLRPVKDEAGSMSPEFIKFIRKTFTQIYLLKQVPVQVEHCYAAPYFDSIYTIELAPLYYEKVQEEFKSNPTIHCYLGDSAKVLPTILPTIEGKILFWLDGHYSGGSSAKGDSNTPILKELLAIKESGIKDAVILVDDMRIFSYQNIPTLDETLLGYPTVQELFRAIKEINPDYVTVIYGDTALAFLPTVNIDVSPVIKACTLCKLGLENSNQTQINQINNAIAQATDEERIAIYSLYRVFPNYLFFKHWHSLCVKKT